jgi:hypothetical protein
MYMQNNPILFPNVFWMMLYKQEYYVGVGCSILRIHPEQQDRNTWTHP